MKLERSLTMSLAPIRLHSMFPGYQETLPHVPQDELARRIKAFDLLVAERELVVGRPVLLVTHSLVNTVHYIVSPYPGWRSPQVLKTTIQAGLVRGAVRSDERGWSIPVQNPKMLGQSIEEGFYHDNEQKTWLINRGFGFDGFDRIECQVGLDDFLNWFEGRP